jgi:hypothetical protein
MKNLILAVALVAVIAAPMLSFACPPPPADGFDGSGSGDGTSVGGDPTFSDGGTEDSGGGGNPDGVGMGDTDA